jgi:gas vesicle protein
MKHDRTSNGLAALGLGLLAGAALGMLFAPTSGAELRERLARRLGLDGTGDDDLDSDGEELDELIT